MPQNTGTYDISALLATQNTTAAQFGLDTIAATLQRDLAAHNALVADMVGQMCEITTDRQRRYGTSVDGEMMEVDEYGRAPTQRASAGATVAFPLRTFQFNVGWDAKYMETATPADIARATASAQQAHLRGIRRELQKAIYRSANYTFNDFLVDKIDLGVKRFVNGDSAAIPNGPNAETFDGSTHSHFNANATLTAAALLANVNDVVEHGFGGRVMTVINVADEAAVRLLSGFKEYADPRLVYRATDTPAQTLDISRLDNRAIGLFGASEVWVKSWGIANYAFSFDAGSPQKPLAFRQRSQTALQGLRLAAHLPSYPLFADVMEAEFGVGVWTRTNGAVLKFDNASYSDPTIS
jgi:hypothetical protein